jgi:UDP-glucose 4-epimerase
MFKVPPHQSSVLVTGGNGFIGQHMCRFLHEKAIKVHIVDNFSSSPKRELHQYGEYHNVDISDASRIKKILRDNKIEAVFHFAAKCLVGESQLKPFYYYQENVVKTLSLLDSCVEVGVRKFIFSSTCATFGLSEGNLPLNENHPQKPLNTYGYSKLLMEKIMTDLSSKNLLDVVIFRYFNAAGCSVDGELGENHDPETHLIPNICLNLLNPNLHPLKIFGNDYETRDGTCIRDYIHVLDLVRAHYLALNFLNSPEGKGIHDFNLGTESGASNLEVIKVFEEVTGKKVNYSFAPRRPGDPPILVGDSKKVQKILKFTPEFTLSQMILHTWNYFSNKKI